jgi:hypothetical protein
MTQESKGEREGEAEEHEEREEHNAHQPDTIDTYPRGSMDHANRITTGETRGRIPEREIGVEDGGR